MPESAKHAPETIAPLVIQFGGVLCERRVFLNDLGTGLPSDWSGHSHLVMELRASTSQRFSLWVYTPDGPRRILIQPFGHGVWFRASIPLQFFQGMDKHGHDMASTVNRRTDAFWMSVWGPFGGISQVDAIGFAMEYPIGRPTLEVRGVHLATGDGGSAFLEKLPVVDELGQWAHGQWVRKAASQSQVDQEIAAEMQALRPASELGLCDSGGYAETKADATGFFRVEQINGRWWFIDPHGHHFLSMGVNCINLPAGVDAGVAADRVNRRLESWGFNTSGSWCAQTSDRRPYTITLRWPTNAATTFLAVPDVYDDAFASAIDTAARDQCAPHQDDPRLIGYFVGNEPPWGGREREVCDMILAGPGTATQAKLRAHLAEGDTPARRTAFVVAAFERWVELACAAIDRHDPNHLNLGIRFAGKPEPEVLRIGRLFDVCSINVYEYEPTKQLERAHRYTGRPVLIGEFHIGVPADGLGAGLVQARDQAERAVAYGYFVEQAAALDAFVGAHWFQWRDQPVLGRFDGENYNIGLVDVTDRPYVELVDAARASHGRLRAIHSGALAPVNRRPLASDAGAPSSPW